MMPVIPPAWVRRPHVAASPPMRFAPPHRGHPFVGIPYYSLTLPYPYGTMGREIMSCRLRRWQMPVHKCSNGKWRIGRGPCMFTTKERADRAYAAYLAIKADTLNKWRKRK